MNHSIKNFFGRLIGIVLVSQLLMSCMGAGGAGSILGGNSFFGTSQATDPQGADAGLSETSTDTSSPDQMGTDSLAPLGIDGSSVDLPVSIAKGDEAPVSLTSPVGMNMYAVSINFNEAVETATGSYLSFINEAIAQDTEESAGTEDSDQDAVASDDVDSDMDADIEIAPELVKGNLTIECDVGGIWAVGETVKLSDYRLFARSSDGMEFSTKVYDDGSCDLFSIYSQIGDEYHFSLRSTQNQNDWADLQVGTKISDRVRKAIYITNSESNKVLYQVAGDAGKTYFVADNTASNDYSFWTMNNSGGGFAHWMFNEALEPIRLEMNQTGSEFGTQLVNGGIILVKLKEETKYVIREVGKKSLDFDINNKIFAYVSNVKTDKLDEIIEKIKAANIKLKVKEKLTDKVGKKMKNVSGKKNLTPEVLLDKLRTKASTFVDLDKELLPQLSIFTDGTYSRKAIEIGKADYQELALDEKMIPTSDDEVSEVLNNKSIGKSKKEAFTKTLLTSAFHGTNITFDLDVDAKLSKSKPVPTLSDSLNKPSPTLSVEDKETLNNLADGKNIELQTRLPEEPVNPENVDQVNDCVSLIKVVRLADMTQSIIDLGSCYYSVNVEMSSMGRLYAMAKYLDEDSHIVSDIFMWEYDFDLNGAYTTNKVTKIFSETNDYYINSFHAAKEGSLLALVHRDKTKDIDGQISLFDAKTLDKKQITHSQKIGFSMPQIITEEGLIVAEGASKVTFKVTNDLNDLKNQIADSIKSGDNGLFSREIYAINISTGKHVAMTRSRGTAFDPQLLPKSGYILYRAKMDGLFQIFILPMRDYIDYIMNAVGEESGEEVVEDSAEEENTSVSDEGVEDNEHQVDGDEEE